MMRASRSFDEFAQRKKQETVNFHTVSDNQGPSKQKQVALKNKNIDG